MMKWSQLGLQDPMSLIMHQLSNFHDFIMLISILIMAFVTYTMLYTMINKFKCRTIQEAHEIETIWTILPAIILIFLALPSLRLLYLMEELNTPNLTIKAIGHQWYWSYEYSDFNNIEFDSYMLPENELNPGQHRLLETDNRVVLPTDTNIRILTTSADVIHAWAIPSLGMKSDALPGRLNQMNIHTPFPSILYGQCSEICGANHTFMPISIEILDTKGFKLWIKSLSEK